jgi:hypothetical protein
LNQKIKKETPTAWHSRYKRGSGQNETEGFKVYHRCATAVARESSESEGKRVGRELKRAREDTTIDDIYAGSLRIAQTQLGPGDSIVCHSGRLTVANNG